jgi:Leucine-rich repeat (LRR) protein
MCFSSIMEMMFQGNGELWELCVTFLNCQEWAQVVRLNTYTAGPDRRGRVQWPIRGFRWSSGKDVPPTLLQDNIQELTLINTSNRDIKLLRRLTSLRKLHLDEYDYSKDADFQHWNIFGQPYDYGHYYRSDPHDFINDDTIEDLNSLINVKELVITDSPFLTDHGLQKLPRLSHLETLSLNGCECIGHDLRFLQGFCKLQILNVGSSGTTNRGLQSLRSLTNLENLDLSDTKINDLGLDVIGSLTQLKNLNLSKNDITDDGLCRLGNLVHLEELYLLDTPITGPGLQVLERLTKLKTLILFQHDLTDYGRSIVQKLGFVEEERDRFGNQRYQRLPKTTS